MLVPGRKKEVVDEDGSGTEQLFEFATESVEWQNLRVGDVVQLGPSEKVP